MVQPAEFSTRRGSFREQFKQKFRVGAGGTAASDPQSGKNSEARSAGLEFSPGCCLTGLVPESADFGLRTPI